MSTKGEEMLTKVREGLERVFEGKSTAERMLEMKLHDVIRDVDIQTDKEGSYEIIRVPGGWIYTMFSSGHVSSTFVPLNNEYQ